MKLMENQSTAGSCTAKRAAVRFAMGAKLIHKYAFSALLREKASSTSQRRGAFGMAAAPPAPASVGDDSGGDGAAEAGSRSESSMIIVCARRVERLPQDLR